MRFRLGEITWIEGVTRTETSVPYSCSQINTKPSAVVAWKDAESATEAIALSCLFTGVLF